MAAYVVKVAEAEGAIHLDGIIAHIRILWGRAGPDLASAPPLNGPQRWLPHTV